MQPADLMISVITAKSGGDYHTYADMGAYFGLDDPANIDYIFLKDNVPAGSTWQSGPINGTITDTSGVFPVSLRVAFTIDQKDVSVDSKRNNLQQCNSSNRKI